MYFNRSILILLLALAIISILGEAEASQPILSEVYQKDYDLINRTVLTFSEKANYRIEERRDERKIVIYVTGAQKHDLVAFNQNFVSPVLESIRITDDAGAFLITITTKQPAFLRSFDIVTNIHKLVLDIYNKQNPENDTEKYIFAKFYYATSNFRRAENHFREIVASSPEITGANYYLGELLLNRNDTKGATERFAQVSYLADEYLQAQSRLFNLGVVNTSFSDETEEAFYAYRSYYLMAGDLNRQKLLLAVAGSLFHDESKTKELLNQIDYNDPMISQMLNNIQEVHQTLQQDKKLREQIPLLMINTTGPNSPLAWYLLIILTAIITAIVVIFVNNLIWSRRVRKMVNIHTPVVPAPVEEVPEPEDIPLEKEVAADLQEEALAPEESEPLSEEKTGIRVAAGFEEEYTPKERLLEQINEHIEKDEIIDEGYEEQLPEIEPQFEKNPYEDYLKEEELVPDKEFDDSSEKIWDKEPQPENVPSEDEPRTLDEEKPLEEVQEEPPPEEEEKPVTFGYPTEDTSKIEDSREPEQEFVPDSDSSIPEESEKELPLNEPESDDEKEQPLAGLYSPDKQFYQDESESEEIHAKSEVNTLPEEPQKTEAVEQEEPIVENSSIDNELIDNYELPVEESEQDELPHYEEKPEATYDIPDRSSTEEEREFPAEQEPDIEEEKPESEKPEAEIEPQREPVTEIPEELKRFIVAPDNGVDREDLEPIVTENLAQESVKEAIPMGESPDLEPSAVIFEDLKLKLIVQLFRLGWGVEAIAEEMETDVNEISRILNKESH